MKIYRRPWLPVKLPDLEVWFNNFSLKLSQFADELGISRDVTTGITEDRDTVKWLADSQAADEANGGGLRRFRDNTLFGRKGEADPVTPVYILPPPPAVYKTRIIERLLKLVDEIEAADNYSTGIGVQLGIIIPKPEMLVPENWTTRLKCKVLSEMRLQIDFKRGESDGINLQILYPGEETWGSIGNFPKSPAIVTIAPKTANSPQAVRIRGKLLNGNTPVGEYSDLLDVVARP
jgi:hypothetical protein